jgi:hypothetical protein|tara:strand:+ start:288 stop:512 length:225 start_codon:yes stop_codon:yes gene_type:complete
MIRAKKANSKRVIDLTGPDGNAYNLLGLAKNFAGQLGYSTLESKALQTEMTSGDYENLLLAFDKAFGSFVILER